MEVKSIFRSALIAHSTFMVDGHNALFERPRHISKLMRTLSKIPADVQEKLTETLAALNQRASRLHPLTEVYVHEGRSRFRWAQLQMIPVHSHVATGLSGTDELGMNYCQATWTALNRLMDKREDIERDWNHAKFTGSCFNPKGVRSIDEKDRSRQEKERHDLEDLKMKVLYRYLNRKSGKDEDPPAHVRLPDGRMAIVDRKHQVETVEELADQLSAALSGEKDFHDLVVERHQKNMKERVKVLDAYNRTMFAPPQVELPPGTKELAGTGVMILGGKAEVDARLARLQAARIDHMEKIRTQRPDMETSDGAPGSEEPED